MGSSATRTADDDALVTEMYRQYRMPLMSYVLRLTAGDRQHAEDVVQETDGPGLASGGLSST